MRDAQLAASQCDRRSTGNSYAVALAPLLTHLFNNAVSFLAAMACIIFQKATIGNKLSQNEYLTR